jgi:drug/metabolite transporter (DMT)-like permease
LPQARLQNLVSQPYLLLLLAPLFWSGNTIAAKLAVGHIEPAALTLFRWLLAMALITPFALPHLKRDWSALRGKLWLMLAYGFFGMGLFNLLLYSAPHYTTAVNISIEQAAIPILVMIGNFVAFRVRTRWLQILGVALTMWGVVLVATHGEPARVLSLSVNQGDGMTLAACGLYALYSLALRYRPDIHWLSFLAVTFTGAALAAVILPLGMATGAAALVPTDVTARGWLIVAYTALFPSIAAQLCYAVSVVRVGPNRASLFINLIPVFGTVMSVLLLAEAFQPYHLIASLFVITGIALAEFAARTRPQVPLT